MDNKLEEQWRLEAEAFNGFYYQAQANLEAAGMLSKQKLLKTKEEWDNNTSNGSNALWGLHIKAELVQALLNHIKDDLTDATLPKAKRKNPDRVIKNSSATKAIKKCLGFNLVYKRTKDGVAERYISKSRRNFFDIKVAAFLTVQLAIDFALAPKVSSKVYNPNSAEMKNLKARPTYTALQKKIGRAVEQQVRYAYINNLMPGWFRKQSAIADHKIDRNGNSRKGMGVSTHNWQSSIRDAIEYRRGVINEYTHLSDEMKAAQLCALTWSEWTDEDRIHIGAFLLTSLIESTKYFQTVLHKSGNKSREYLELSLLGELRREDFLEGAQQFCYDNTPMLVEPLDNKKNKLGGWLNPASHHRPPGFDGKLHISDDHLRLINQVQKVPYRLNPFITELLEFCYDKQLAVGKWFPYTTKEPASVAQRLGYGSVSDYDEQTALVVSHPDFKVKMRERSDDIEQEKVKSAKSVATRQLYLQIQKVKEFEKFYLPCSWDFRGRIYYRTGHLRPAGVDPAKAVLEYADGYEIAGTRAIYWTQIELANAMGFDKKSYETRVNEVVRRHEEIKVVATCFDGNGNPMDAIKIIEQYPDPWLAARAMREYYLMVLAPIDQRITKTHIRTSIDACSQGAQIHSGWRRSAAGASKVNALPVDGDPADIYQLLWEKIVDLAIHEGTIRPKMLRLYSASGKKLGRKLAKKAFMSAQYGSGVDVQIRDIKDEHTTFPLSEQLEEEELSLIFSVLSDAIDHITSIKTIVNWFRDQSKLVFERGDRYLKLPLPDGSVVFQRYAKRKEVRIETFHHGQLRFSPDEDVKETTEHRFTIHKHSRKPDISNHLKAVAANITHGADSALLVFALVDWQVPISTVHDSVATSPVFMDELQKRLTYGYLKVIQWDVFKEFCKANNLPYDEANSIVIGDLDLAKVACCNYLFC